MPKKAYFGAKMAAFGPNILITLGGLRHCGRQEQQGGEDQGGLKLCIE